MQALLKDIRDNLVRGQASNLLGRRGEVFWLDNSCPQATDAGHGERLAPFSTLAGALTYMAVSGRPRTQFGDELRVGAGHDETITSNVTISIANLRIVGLGGGTAEIGTFRLTDAKIILAEGNITLDNLRIGSSTGNVGNVVTSLIECVGSSSGFVLRRLRTQQTGSTQQTDAAILISATTANSGFIENCQFTQSSAGGAAYAIRGTSTGTEIVIRNNYFHGYWATNVISGSGAMTRMVIDNNIMHNQGAGTCITLAASTTGSITNNRLSNDGTAALLSVPSTMKLMGNMGDTGSLDAGAVFTITKTLTSSAIVAAGVDISGLATGTIGIEDVVMKTNGTGLAGATAVTVESNNTNGQPVIMQTAVSGLGANKTIDLANASVTKIKTVLESGKKLLSKPTVADGTGAGTVTITITCRRLTPGAELLAA